MALKPSERQRIRTLTSAIYADGYGDGMGQLASKLDLNQHVPNAALRMEPRLKVRMDFVDQAVDSYIEAVERKSVELRAEGLRGDQLMHEVRSFAERLATDKAQLVAQIEHASGRFNGAGDLVSESGEEFEWRFPHFELGSADHEECPVCEAIREGSPYSTEEAEEEGFPDVPHPNCDHGWVIVPKGAETRTEAFPPMKFAGSVDVGFTKHYEDGSCTPGEIGNPEYSCGGGSGGGGSGVKNPSSESDAKTWAENLSDEQRQDVDYYTREASVAADINGKMRDGRALSPDQDRIARNLTASIEAAGKFEKPVQVWRGVAVPQEKIQPLLDSVRAGGKPELTLNGFASTSQNDSTAFGSARAGGVGGRTGVVFSITTDRGAPVWGVSQNRVEREVLLGHGWKYEVTGYQERQGTPVVSLRLKSVS